MSSSCTVTDHGDHVTVAGHAAADLLTALGKAWKKRGLTFIAPGDSAGYPSADFVVASGPTLKRLREATAAAAEASSGGDRELAWLRGPDTGTSSLTIFSVLSGHHGAVALARLPWGADLPMDPDDFGRCHRLVEALGWRSRLHEVVAVHRDWRALVEGWDELTALYLAELPSGRCPKTYDLMRALKR